MTAYTFNMPSGIAGDITRTEHAVVEAALLDTQLLPIAYGVPVKKVAGLVRGIQAADVLPNPFVGANVLVNGFMVRPYPTNAAQDAVGAQTMPTSGIVDIMKKGYMMVAVKFNAASCAADGQVFVRTGTATHNGAGYVVGQLEGAQDTADCAAVPHCYWTGAADAQGFCEIAFNILA